MPTEFPGSYAFICKELEIIVADLFELATKTDQQITIAQAKVAHTHLNYILKQLMLATRLSRDAFLEEEKIQPASPANGQARTCQYRSTQITTIDYLFVIH